MFDALFESIKEIIIESLMFVFQSFFAGPNINNAGNMVSQTPGAFSATSLALAENINNYVILPVAGVILTYVMVLELISLVTDYNNMHENTTMGLYKWMFKTFLAIMLVSHAFEISTAIMEAGASLVMDSIPYATGETGTLMTEMEASLEQYGIGELLIALITTVVSGIAVWVAQLFIWVVIITRFMSIYMNLAVASIPFATLSSEKLNGTGLNYIKNMIGIALQGVIIIVALAVYGAISASPLDIGTPGGGMMAILQIMVKPLVLLLSLIVIIMKSKSIANSIVGSY